MINIIIFLKNLMNGITTSYIVNQINMYIIIIIN